MKKSTIAAALLLAGSAFIAISCKSDDDPSPAVIEDPSAADLDYTPANADSWHNYMIHVANLLNADAASLYEAWDKDYAARFKAHAGGDYTSAQGCLEQVVDGCIDIANEVGTAKIGEPYDYYISGKTVQALYAVESWYSWHSREDYSNNILSIRNAFYGSRGNTVAEASLLNVVKDVDAAAATTVDNLITAAYDAILDIPQPFRNHIVCSESEAAMEACAALCECLENQIRPLLARADEAAMERAVANYVDNVVMPTYGQLKQRVALLQAAIVKLNAERTTANFAAAGEAWLSAREPWEKSEAFLFGPVSDMGLDPNMDSWPLDKDAIVNIMKSGNWSALEWSGDYDEDSEAIGAAQNVRGFHTLEYLIFKNGQARTCAAGS